MMVDFIHHLVLDLIFRFCHTVLLFLVHTTWWTKAEPDADRYCFFFFVTTFSQKYADKLFPTRYFEAGLL